MADEITETSQTVAAGQLRAFIERIERLEEEKKTISDDIRDVYAEGKGNGFDVKALRQIKKDYERLKLEHDLLKKAIAFTSARKAKSSSSSKRINKASPSK